MDKCIIERDITTIDVIIGDKLLTGALTTNNINCEKGWCTAYITIPEIKKEYSYNLTKDEFNEIKKKGKVDLTEDLTIESKIIE
jgi:hypothetical protein